MRFTLATALIALQGAGVLSASIEAQCGKLGVMKINKADLPAGADPNAVRLCDEHPVTTEVNVFERACYTAKTVGCSRGYCFRQCTTSTVGSWCWTALNLGVGNWINCTQDSDCSILGVCGVGTNCAACGCSC